MNERDDLRVIVVEGEQTVASGVELRRSGGETGAEGVDFGRRFAVASVDGVVCLFEETAFRIRRRGVGDAIELREGEGFSVASDVFARKDDGVARFSGGAIGLAATSSVDGVDGRHGGRLVQAEIRRFDGEEGRVGFHVTTSNNNQPVGCHMR